jgi:hypothetical protein
LARDIEVEQGRAPAFLPHHDELAGTTVDQSRGRSPDDRRDHHPHRAAARAELDDSAYDTGVKISDAQMAPCP